MQLTPTVREKRLHGICQKALKLEDKKMYRISFNEITKNAVKASIKDAREIDMNLVDAQQARRALDRIVGYKISPLLWAKVKRGLSAGRVQSVALRIIADREEEINAFIPEEYWTLDAKIKVEGERKPLLAKFYGTDGKKIVIHSKEELGTDYEGSRGCTILCRRYQKGREDKESTSSVYYEYIAAGSIKSAELCNTEDNANCAAAL